MTRILVTGFERFGPNDLNPSALLMDRLSGRDGVVAAVLPVEYGTSVARFEALLERHRPDAAIAFGLARCTDRIRLERVALNLDEAAAPDNAGVVRNGLRIAEDGPVGYWSSLPVDSMIAALDLLAGLPFAGPLRRSVWAYALVNAAHILGIGLLLGAILPLDLRMLGVLRGPSLAVIVPFLSRMAGAGLGLAVLTGFCLWSVSATEYLGNAAFRWKLVLLVAALGNVALLHRLGWQRVVVTGVADTAMRVLAGISAGLWLSVLLAGRWVGFL